MTEPTAPERIAVSWSPEARADLRAIDREPTPQILHGLDHYLASRAGDVKKLKHPLTGFRLRCGDLYIATVGPKSKIGNRKHVLSEANGSKFARPLV